MRKQMIAAAAVLVMCASGVLAAQAQQADAQRYRWSGEFISFDSSGHTLTVKARLAGSSAIAELKRMKAGDRVLLTWSGYEDYADAIWMVRRAPAAWKAEKFVLPAELVSTEAPNDYLTFKIRVPAASVSALMAIKPGEWVTVTSSQNAAREADTVISAEAYSRSSHTAAS